MIIIFSNNCEHLVKSCVFGIEESPQTSILESLSPFHAFNGATRTMNRLNNLKDKIRLNSDWLDSLTSSYSYEKGKIEQYIRETENNRSYTRSKYQIEQEKFEERIVVYPKGWCRIS